MSVDDDRSPDDDGSPSLRLLQLSSPPAHDSGSAGTTTSLFTKVFAWIERRLGADALEAARFEFANAAWLPVARAVVDREPPLFATWVATAWYPDLPDDVLADLPDDVSHWEGSPIGRTMLADPAAGLEEDERRALLAHLASPASFYQVVDAHPGRSLLLRDLFRDQTVIVSERTASKSLEPGDVFFARLGHRDGARIVSASGAIRLGASVVPALYHLRILLEGDGGGPVETEVLIRHAGDLLAAYLDLATEEQHRHLPSVVNLDGDRLELHRLEWRVEDPDATVRALAPLTGRRGTKGLEAVGRDRRRRTTSAAWCWLGPEANDTLPRGRRILAELSIEGRSLVVTVNSARRADAVRREIEERLGPAARFAADDVTTLPELLLAASARGAVIEDD